MIPLCSRLGSLVLAALIAGPDGTRALAPALPPSAQEEAETADAEPVVVSTAPHWEVGERYVIECVKEQEQRFGAQRAWGGTSTPIEVEVRAKGEDGRYRIAWTWGRASALEGSLSGALDESVATVNEGLVTEFETDPTGVPERLVNLEEMRAFQESKLEEVERRSEGLSRVQARRMRSAFEAAAKVDLLGPIFLGYARTCYMLTGWELELGGVAEWEEPFTLPIGGATCSATSTLEAVELRADGTQVVCRWQMEIDPEEMARALTETIAAVDRQSGRETQVPEELPALDVDVSGTYVSDVRTGRPVFAETRTAIEVEGRIRVDVKRFRVLPAAPAEAPGAGEDGTSGGGGR